MTSEIFLAFPGENFRGLFFMSGVPFYAKRWISGLTMPEALDSVSALNARQIGASLDILGENIKDLKQAEIFTNEYVSLLLQIESRKINSHVSVKLTMLGLDIDENACYQNLCKILTQADKSNSRVALDMEGTPYTERTLAMYERAAKTFKSPEIVLQAYLNRTADDVDRVLKANGKLRLCKGAYKEPADLAIQDMSKIVANYKTLLEKLLLQGKYVAIATHDDGIIQHAKDLIAKYKVPNDRYEFQMLYGMRSKTWDDITRSGYPMVIYVPYGKQWQAYYSRRLLERKENVFFVLKNLFRS